MKRGRGEHENSVGRSRHGSGRRSERRVGGLLGIALASSLVVAVGIAIPSCRDSSPTASTAKKPPNVLLITLDTTRADRLGCYGYSRPTSPNIDALAADAARFEVAVATSALTPPSHASILTGLYPHHHGLRVIYGPVGHFLSDVHPTVAAILRARGWQTGAFISAYPASERFGLNHGFETFATDVAESVMVQNPRKRMPRDVRWARRRRALAQRRADATTDEALAWLERARRPFFAWVHYYDPHDPSLIPPEEVTDRFSFSQEDPNPQLAVYDPEIFFMDAHIGRLFERLEANGEYDDTVIVVVSDHGQGLGDHGWFQHRLLYQEQIRTPLIVRAPTGPRGQVMGALASGVDVAPTILAAAGVAVPETMDGRDLLGAKAGGDSAKRIALAEALNTVDFHAHRGLPKHQKDLLFCAMDREWKLIHHRNHPENSELYDLANDPGESTNVATQHPQEKERLLRWLRDSGAMKIEKVESDAPLDEDSIRMLESLGYIHRGSDASD